MYLFMYSCTHCNRTITGYIRVHVCISFVHSNVHMYEQLKEKWFHYPKYFTQKQKEKEKEKEKRINKGKSVPIKIDKGVLALT